MSGIEVLPELVVAESRVLGPAEPELGDPEPAGLVEAGAGWTYSVEVPEAAGGTTVQCTYIAAGCFGIRTPGSWVVLIDSLENSDFLNSEVAGCSKHHLVDRAYTA